MKNEKNRTILGMDEHTFRRFLRFLMLPGAVLVLVLIILLADAPRRKAKKEAEAAAAAAASASEMTAAAETEPVWVTVDYATAEPVPNEVPEIDALVAAYLDARKTGNAEELFRVFGRTEFDDYEAVAAKMNEERKVIEDFTDTEIFTIPGIDRDSYLVYIRTNGWFKKVIDPAPLFFRAYVMRKAEGNYIMKEDSTLTDAEREAVRLADGAPAVAAMNNEQRAALARAIVSDGKLGSLYESMREKAPDEMVCVDEPAAETTAAAPAPAGETSEAVVQVIVETEAAGEAVSGNAEAAPPEIAIATEAAETGAEGAESAAAEGAESGAAEGAEAAAAEGAEAGAEAAGAEGAVTGAENAEAGAGNAETAGENAEGADSAAANAEMVAETAAETAAETEASGT